MLVSNINLLMKIPALAGGYVGIPYTFLYIFLFFCTIQAVP